jgi:hypothetical protein
VYRTLTFAILLIVASNTDLAQGQDQSLPQPTQQVILTIMGKIERKNSEAAALFDRPMLEALGLETLRTSTAWTDGTVEFVGVPVRKLMQAVGARGKTVMASALDNYHVQIPMSDFEQYPVLFALRMEGKELNSDRGPIWIVYPRDNFPQLQNESVDARWIWQLSKLTVE